MGGERPRGRPLSQFGGAHEQHDGASDRSATCYNIAWRTGRIFLIIYLLLLLAMMVFENSLIYFPMNFPEDDWAPRGITVEDAWFTAADGTKIHGRFAPHEPPRAVVLFCHGNAGNITHRADILRALHNRMGAAVLAFDYRGYRQESR